MKTFFICLANSKKYNERCIAGIEVAMNWDGKVETVFDLVSGQWIKKVWPGGTDGATIEIISDKSGPKWIRPVFHNEHGEVPTVLVSNINLLDVVEIDVTEKCPDGYQAENVFFDSNSLKVIGKIELDILDQLVSTRSNLLFGNRDKAISFKDIGSVDHSLIFVKVSNPKIYFMTREYKNIQQLRAKFWYKNNEYDLPITDIDFEKQYGTNKNLLENKQVYFTISLGEKYKDLYCKLVAGIVYFEN